MAVGIAGEAGLVLGIAAGIVGLMGAAAVIGVVVGGGVVSVAGVVAIRADDSPNRPIRINTGFDFDITMSLGWEEDVLAVS